MRFPFPSVPVRKKKKNRRAHERWRTKREINYLRRLAGSFLMLRYSLNLASVSSRSACFPMRIENRLKSRRGRTRGERNKCCSQAAVECPSSIVNGRRHRRNDRPKRSRRLAFRDNFYLMMQIIDTIFVPGASDGREREMGSKQTNEKTGKRFSMLLSGLPEKKM